MWRISVIPRGSRDQQLFTHQQFKDYFDVEYISYLHFPTPKFRAEAIKRCPILLRSSLGDDNRELGTRFEDELDGGYVAPVCIQWINDDIGHGVFAKQFLPKGSFVGEFTGCVRRLYRLSSDHNAYCFHFPTRFFSWKYTVIDASKMGNETRFINHSDSPNLQPLCLIDEESLLHICFVTAKDVKRNEELTYNYGADFWRNRS